MMLANGFETENCFHQTLAKTCGAEATSATAADTRADQAIADLRRARQAISDIMGGK